MHPVDALTETAYLLERERSSRYKSKACRRAADAIAELDPASLRDPVRWRALPGIGDSTVAVIRQALAGEVPDYLSRLRADNGPAQSELRTKLRGDLHAHSEWSDGTT